MIKTWLTGVAVIGIGSLPALTPAAGNSASLVPYPDGYRAWRHLGSVFNPPTDHNRGVAPHGMIHHLYANEPALEGMRTGQFPEGAVLVADWFPLQEKYPGGFDEGARDRTDVMVRDARFAETGGWGFEQFVGDSQTVRNVAPGSATTQCFKCHQRVEKRGYVFSRLRG